MNGMDMVYAEVKRRMDPEIQERMEQLAGVLFPALNDGTPLEQVPNPPPPGTPAPKSAAGRTLIQGVVATGLATGLGFAVETISNDDFQVFDLGDWKGLGSGALIAGLMSVLAFGQRKIGR